ncbi:hypothetical protein JCM10212_004154 [Sporobolomyces blumeae]
MATTAAASLRLQASSDATSSSSRPRSEFIQFKATMRLPIPPVFASNGQHDPSAGDGGMDGVREVLAGWVMRYLPPLQAVVLSFSPTPRFLHPAADFAAAASPFDSPSSLLKNPKDYLASPPPDDVKDDSDSLGDKVRLKTLPMIDGSGFTLADVEWEGLGWRPQVGMRLIGTPTLSTSSHMSLLIHNLFNASIPSSHIPSDRYEFDPTCPVPAIVLERREKGISAGGSAGGMKALEDKAKQSAREALGIDGDDDDGKDSDDEDAGEKDEDEKDAEEEEEFAEVGWWVDKKTREPLGGQQGRLEFTLAALSTSNSLLSCTGSLLSDPFTPSALASLQDPSASSSSTSASPALALAQAQAVRSGHGKRTGLAGDSDRDSSDSEGASDDEDDDGELDHDDDDGVGTGVPRHEGVPGSKEDPTRSDSDESSESSESESESESESDASSRSPTPEPEKKKKQKVAVKEDKKGSKGRTTAEKKGKPPQVKPDPEVAEVKVKKEKKVGSGGKDKKDKKRKEGAIDSPEQRKSKKAKRG